MHIHILGICGTFMGGLAALAREAGHRVTGCDEAVYPPMSDQLRELGIELIQGYSLRQLTLKPDVFVVGNVVKRGNPLMEAILDHGLPYASGPQWLAEHILPGRHVLAVAGTHGKTTTSSMLAWILEATGRDPGFLIGGIPENFGISARLGQSKYFVIEADEYDTAFFDKRSKFVHYRPRTLVLNNLEFDHADIFEDVRAIERQFHHVVRTVPASGRLIVNERDPHLRNVLGMGAWSPIVTFAGDGGFDATVDGSTLRLRYKAAELGAVEWQLLGEHNALNAAAAIAAAQHARVPVEEGLQALTSFRGVKRRMQVRGSVGGVTVYDDFAHHPTAIRVTLEGLRRRLGAGGRIVAVFEPRSNTMKLGTMKAQLPEAFTTADLVFCYAEHLGWDPRQALEPLGDRAITVASIPELIEQLVATARGGDHIVFMSNGSFGQVHDKLLAALRQRPPST